MSGQSPMNILNKLKSPLAVLAAIAECDRLGRSQFLARYHFHHSTEYVLKYKGREYDSKAIAAVAFGLQHGTRALNARECEGGKAYGRAAWAIFRLGFRISGMREEKEWRVDEVEPTVETYFKLLDEKERGAPINLRDTLRHLHEENPKRTLYAFRRKLGNISAALKTLGLPHLKEFPPDHADHFQKLVLYILKDKFGLHEHEEINLSRSQENETGSGKINWAARDAQNRELGEAGEKYILESQQKHLTDIGRPELSKKVRWISPVSDNFGYDIESYDDNGMKIKIEVKTTARALETSFYVTANELAVSKECADTYQLHRVYQFFGNRKVAVRTGALEDYCKLQPSIFRANLV